MHNCYSDILERIPEPPTWFDDYAVPRYSRFTPDQLANIYADEAALAEVSCQACGRPFRVALSGGFAEPEFSLGDEIRLARVGYGDPPNVGCCPGGPTMTSVMHAIVEYWSRDIGYSLGWNRDPTLEGTVSAEPFDPPDTVADVLAAVRDGCRTVRVPCTSKRRRLHLAGRVAAALAADGPVVIVHPENWSGALGSHMVRGLVPDESVGNWRERRRVTVVGYDRLGGFSPVPGARFVVLAAPAPGHDAARGAWGVAAARLAAEVGTVRVEFVLPGSQPMLERPDVVVDSARVVRRAP